MSRALFAAVLLAGWALTPGCAKPTTEPQRAPSSSQTATAAPSASAPASAASAATATSTAATSSPAPAHAAPDPRLARFAWIEPGTASGLAAGCAAPHAFGRPRDTKAPADLVLPEVLRVFTELRRVDYGAVRAAFELGFAPRSSDGARWVASCGDVRTCEILAGLYRRIDPDGGVQLHCGAPPNFTASGSKSDIGAALPLDELRTQPAACARIRACQLGLEEKQLTVCQPMPAAPLLRCARREACGEVSECAKAFERDWERKHPRPALPQPRNPPPGIDELPEGVGY